MIGFRTYRPLRPLCRFGAMALLLLSMPGLERTSSAAMASGFSLAFGNGTCLTDDKLRSTFISPSVSWTVTESHLMEISVGGTFELLNNGRLAGWITGGGPYIKFTPALFSLEPMLEIGLGLNYISAKSLGGRALGTNFLFGESALLGLGFEAKQTHFTVSYMFRHLSNAGLSVENDGINFHYLIISMSP